MCSCHMDMMLIHNLQMNIEHVFILCVNLIFFYLLSRMGRFHFKFTPGFDVSVAKYLVFFQMTHIDTVCQHKDNKRLTKENYLSRPICLLSLFFLIRSLSLERDAKMSFRNMIHSGANPLSAMISFTYSLCC